MISGPRYGGGQLLGTSHQQVWRNIKTTPWVRLIAHITCQLLSSPSRGCSPRKIHDKYAVMHLQHPIPTPNELHFNEFLMQSLSIYSPDGFLLMDCPAACGALIRYLLFQEAWRLTFLMAVAHFLSAFACWCSECCKIPWCIAMIC